MKFENILTEEYEMPHVTPVPHEKEDLVNHPNHYTSSSNGIECIDAIEAAVESYDSPVIGWYVGQVIKYLWRAPLKGTYLQDLKKAQFYLNRLIAKTEKAYEAIQ